MRLPLLLALCGLLTLAPAIRARSCVCARASGFDGGAPKSACCCGDSACACPGCEGHHRGNLFPDRDEKGPRALEGCVCTDSPPQWNPEPESDEAPPPTRTHVVAAVPPAAPAVAPITIEGRRAAPASYQPLLL